MQVGLRVGDGVLTQDGNTEFGGEVTLTLPDKRHTRRRQIGSTCHDSWAAGRLGGWEAVGDTETRMRVPERTFTESRNALTRMNRR